MNDPEEMEKILELSLGEERIEKYRKLLKQWFRLHKPITKTTFEIQLRKLLTSDEEIRYHNNYMLSTFKSDYIVKVEKDVFEYADLTEYVQSCSPDPEIVSPPELKYRSVSSELFMPDSTLMKTRIRFLAWENGFKGAEDGVIELLIDACQVFVKNIITAMITKKETYKIKEKKLQCGFGLPTTDPFVRNSHRILKSVREVRDVPVTASNFGPATHVPLEIRENETAVAYSCPRKAPTDETLTVQLLYDTLLEDPHIVGLHSINSLNLFKVSLQLDDP